MKSFFILLNPLEMKLEMLAIDEICNPFYSGLEFI